jgi:hypothetical protein
MDRDGKFSELFRMTMQEAGIEPVRLPPRSPNLNSHIERFMRSLKEECLGRMIFFGEKALQAATASYLEHFLTERNHQGMGNQLLLPGSGVGKTAGEIACRERLGGRRIGKAQVLLPQSGMNSFDLFQPMATTFCAVVRTQSQNLARNLDFAVSGFGIPGSLHPSSVEKVPLIQFKHAEERSFDRRRSKFTKRGPITAALALLLGLSAGYLRARSGSLLPAILVHAMFNIAGSIGSFV